MVLHALRVLREWIRTTDQTQFGGIQTCVGDALVTYHIRKWMRTGQCHLQSAAASGSVADVQSLPHWLATETSLFPLFLPEQMGEETVSPQLELLLRLAEHFRTSILPLLGPEWRRTLPRLPITTQELKDVPVRWDLLGEQRVMSDPALAGSSSARIIMDLGLTREIIAEAFVCLRGERARQVTLARILSATRCKVLTAGKICHANCPKDYCYRRGSFARMLTCYNLHQLVQKGPMATQFLVKIARLTHIPPSRMVIPYMAEYSQDAES